MSMPKNAPDRRKGGPGPGPPPAVTPDLFRGPPGPTLRLSFHGREPTLPVNAPVLFYLRRLRDEVHRFAIADHRAKRARPSARARWTKSRASARRGKGRC